MVTCQSSELGWEVTVELPADFLSLVELANRAGGSGWAEPTPGQENNRVDRAGPDLNRAAISLTQLGPISG